MENPKLRGGLNALGWLLSMGVTVSGVVVPAVGYTLLVLMVPVSVWTFWPWAKRLRLRLPVFFANAEGESPANTKPDEHGFFPMKVTRGDSAAAIQSRDAENERLKKHSRRIEQENERLQAFLADPDAKKRREEEMLRRRCVVVARDVETFTFGHNSRWQDQDEVVARFKLRHEPKVEKLRDELDQAEWLADEEREILTLSPFDGLEKIKLMAAALRAIGAGH